MMARNDWNLLGTVASGASLPLTLSAVQVRRDGEPRPHGVMLALFFVNDAGAHVAGDGATEVLDFSVLIEPRAGFNGVAADVDDYEGNGAPYEVAGLSYGRFTVRLDAVDAFPAGATGVMVLWAPN